MNTCRICGFHGDTKEWIVKEMMYGTWEEFPYFLCPECNCMQIKEIPKDMSPYYQTDYYSYAKRENIGKRETPVKSEKRILDVGCGSGAFLCMLAMKGEGNLTGCDPFIEEDIFYENGVKIYKKSIHEMEGQYDFIFLNDSYEHVTDPHEVMESLNRLLAPGGMIRISIPVYPNIAFDMFAENWYELDAPRHIYIHSKKSMNYIAEKHGLKVVKAVWNSNNAQIVRSHLVSLGISYREQTQEVLTQYFTPQDLDDLEKQCEEVNQNEYGDHAEFYLVHQDY